MMTATRATRKAPPAAPPAIAFTGKLLITSGMLVDVGVLVPPETVEEASGVVTTAVVTPLVPG